MSDNKTKQTGNTVTDGSIVGRDSNTYQIHGNVSPITKLSMDFMKEASDSEEFKSIIPELEHYMTNIDANTVIGLEEKLKAANKLNILSDAQRQKEIVAKKLHQHSTSRAAQGIYTLVLGAILNRFRTYVKPLIDEGESEVVINQSIFTDVIEPTLKSLENNVLEMYWDDMWGMVYYLTGNCHIKWTP